ncbi:MAG TPA: peptidyl-prolyl cis-trans isomerase [Thermoanaerobaculia bacterium]|nr:peptidyl-prolyl cis-trans isomerase [Thermoanaerobaculia bacterium]
MKRIVFYSIPVLIILGLMWGYAASHEPAAAPAGEQAWPTSVPNDEILIEVNGEPIYASEWEAAVQRVPEEMRFQLNTPGARRRFAEELVRIRLLEQEGRRMGLERAKEVAGQLRFSYDSILAQAALERLVQQKSAEDLRAVYERNRDRFETIEAQQIMIAYQGSRAQVDGNLPSRQEAAQRAAALFERIRGGVSFEEVAQEVANDPVIRVGEVGAVSRGSVPPAVETALFSLQPGEVSEPVTTQFGIHLFKVTARSIQPFEEVEPLLKDQGRQLVAGEILEGLREKAVVEMDPEIFGPEPSGDAGPGDPLP